jgi:hypothetical protein
VQIEKMTVFNNLDLAGIGQKADLKGISRASPKADLRSTTQGNDLLIRTGRRLRL